MKSLNFISAIAFSSLLVACASTNSSIEDIAYTPTGVPIMVTYTLNDGKDWEEVSAGLQGWGDGVAEFRVADEQADVQIKKQATNEWNIQLKRPLFLVEDMKYEISVEASADVPSDIAFVVQQDGGEYTTYFHRPERVTTQPQVFTYQFAMPNDEKNGAFAITFGKGSPGVTYHLKNIRFSSVY
ncbi:carbohydrate binding domain-containing protein [Agarivorans gilvus]|uniref:CBM-cenC domain-containing protein n=1 Tax=Agarivorans gilvus TaxID=680279 RepID=A0ABQ1I382_9ALTE|nr:carbohydrate binding domain-containing protein [Agarivorans gilvus]GGB07782.1 hypothetical protein GCM10007414_21480 [Agarivorans gilvus]